MEAEEHYELEPTPVQDTVDPTQDAETSLESLEVPSVPEESSEVDQIAETEDLIDESALIDAPATDENASALGPYTIQFFQEMFVVSKVPHLIPVSGSVFL